MTLKEIKEMDTERLILALCIRYDNETKRARTEEKKIIEELARRNIVDEDYMKRLMDQ